MTQATVTRVFRYKWSKRNCKLYVETQVQMIVHSVFQNWYKRKAIRFWGWGGGEQYEQMLF